MAVNLKGRSLLKLLDYSKEEIEYLIDLSRDLKEKKKKGEIHKYLEGKNIVLLFEKTSTRTRCAFEVAASDLGMGVTFLDSNSSQMGNKESIEDTAKVLGRFYDGIEYRGFSQDIVEDLSKYSGVPVWNGLTDEFHPTQMIADMLTISENFKGNFKGLKFTFVGDARNNVANSLMVVCAKLGMDFTATAPKDLFPNEDLVNVCREICKESGGSITLTEDILEGTKDRDIIYTDIWVSMGEPKEIWKERIEKLSPYQVNDKVMENASDKAIFMHCLPSFHDRETTIGEEIYKEFNISEMEVTDKVFRSNKSKVFDEAENRMHSIKAIMLSTLK